MVKVPREVGGYVVLPLKLPATEAFPKEINHYLYLRPHEPMLPDEDAPRSLFLVNIPISATTQSLKYLLTTRLEGGRVDKVHFADHAPGKPGAAPKASRKRKRMTAEELEAGLDKYSLPEVFDSQIHPSGSTAIIVFVDRSSMELTLKAARRAAKSATPITWNDGAESLVPRLGLTRYEHHKELQFPSRKELLRSVNGFMTAYAQMEESRSRENARKRQEPDEDGFITVTRGSKGGARMDEAKELAEKQKGKNKGVEDFYRFQMREKRKEQQTEMLKKFEEDKRKVEEMRQRRGKLTVGAKFSHWYPSLLTMKKPD
ncbi:uncharacterized protein Z518_02835 [Rhinocladiella mackenziei CBS 650.93]|uniref:Ribosomal RNA-processing protein 7 n=1 Tax=Rhinocladiella mackenziei CBS 650.93 TaxID=1442369 RepID=A0A0D2IQG6_9EURO|nr:uncharacterized protein Z518_02835 [Rhinocladiella mackenziei CBS 650.93]KIX08179.1 hypothetical protein Z518_02835 [Rhinocladiella mackenziei CBS 650.93]